MEHRAGAPGDANIAGLEHLKRQERSVHQVPQFMGEEPEPLASACGLSIYAGLISFTSVLSHRAAAIASSRHRFSVRKSSVLIGAFSSTASSVMA
jgi:hypothetical protein